MTIYRMATEADVDELAQMRWDFRLEEARGATVHGQTTFLYACTAFLRQGLAEQRWTYWVAQEDTQIVSHIYIQRVPKVPKPNRLDDALGYVTNVYTRPAYRGQGIGTRFMTHVLQWARSPVAALTRRPSRRRWWRWQAFSLTNARLVMNTMYRAAQSIGKRAET